MKKTLTVLLLSFLFMSTSQAADPKLNYKLSFDEAYAHYVDVQMNVSGINDDAFVVKMPVWAPGSYLIREFARNVEGFEAYAGDKKLKTEKVRKNAWKIYGTKSQNVTIKYKVYAFELTVRTSFIDEAHAYLNGSSVFMFIDGKQNLPATINVKPYKNWKEISCGLDAEKGDKWTLSSPNYDILADSPMEIGNQEILEFTSGGVPHQIALYGGGNYEREKLTADVKKITEEATSVVGVHPCKHYTFIVHCVPSGGGGLEHLNSTTVQVSKFNFSNETTYKNFLSLIAHEYFHLWNVKRIRPIVLGPFDYDNENYTSMLWFSEGFTAYYDNLLTRRAGYYTPDAYLEVMATDINRVENQPGAKTQSASEASYDAWIKYYRPNENSTNSTISYYDKGSILGMLMDLEILKSTKGEKDLDDLMKYLYNEFYLGKKRGFTDEEFKASVEKVSGKNFDEFFAKYVNGVNPIPYNDFLSTVGLRLADQSQGKKEVFFGVNTKNDAGKIMVTSVVRGSCAYIAGINVNDEIVAIDNYRVDDLAKWIGYKKAGDKIKVTVTREGAEKNIDVVLAESKAVRFKFEQVSNPTAEQTAAYNKWLKIQ